MKGFTLINDTELKTNNFIANLTLFYIKDNIKISITYDYFCNSYQEKENNKVVNINSSHSKPDYIINIYVFTPTPSILRQGGLGNTNYGVPLDKVGPRKSQTTTY